MLGGIHGTDETSMSCARKEHIMRKTNGSDVFLEGRTLPENADPIVRREDRKREMIGMFLALTRTAHFIAACGLISLLPGCRTKPEPALNSSEGAALNHLKSLVVAQREHRKETGTYARFPDLTNQVGKPRVPALWPDPLPNNPMADGYTFWLFRADANGFYICATPNSSAAAMATFIVNDGGIIYVKNRETQDPVETWPSRPARDGWTRVP